MIRDFNMNPLKYHGNAKTKYFYDNIFKKGAIPIISRPTRISEHSISLIDRKGKQKGKKIISIHKITLRKVSRSYKFIKHFLTLYAPISQNDKFADELFEYVWPFCEIGA